MKSTTLFCMMTLSLALCCGNVMAQQSTDYTESANPTATRVTDWEIVKAPRIGWGTTDVRYEKEKPAQGLTPAVAVTAWKGERVSAQAVVSTPTPMQELNIEVSDLKAGSATIASSQIRKAFVRYVISEKYNREKKNQCGHNNLSALDSLLVSDPIDHLTTKMAIEANSTRPMWFTISVPQDAKAGNYVGSVTIKDGEKTLKTLKLTVTVKNHVLPQPKDWAFHLDLWQNPYASARYYNVQPFSKEHFEIMRPMMELYVNAGGKTITTSIMNKPWNGQTEDPFQSMITWIKKADGTWMYDYTAFDRWVEFMMSLGIKNHISCYSMVPWRLSFRYLDQATDSFKEIQTKPGDAEYEEYWVRMLTDFAKHLKTKGWFDITYIAMDERPMEAMLKTLAVIRKADTHFKVALAGSYHDELASELDDYCITLGEHFPKDVIAKRKAAGMNTVFYTCCAETQPNTFVMSYPAEAEWIAWHSACEGLNGYLRWAYNSWVKDPLHDSRFRSWAAGDTFFVYPDARSSIRFERLTEGIQQYEKIRLLREEFTAKNNTKALQKLDAIIKPFVAENLLKTTAADMINTAKKALNNL